MTKLHITILVFCFIATTGFTISLQQENREAIKVGIYDNPPLISADSKGKAQGLFIDILNNVAQKKGWKYEYQHFTLEEAIKAAKESRIDILPGLAYSNDRAKDLLYSQNVIFHNWAVVYTCPDSRVKNISDMNQVSVGMERGDIHSDAFIKLLNDFNISADIHWFNNHDQLFKALCKGEIETVAANKLFGFIHNNPKFVRETSILFNPVHIHFAGSKKAGKIMTALDKEISCLLTETPEVYNNFIGRWLLIHEVEDNTWLNILWISLFAILAILIIYLISLRLIVKRKENDLSKELELRKKNEELIAQLENEKALILNSIEDQVLFIDNHHHILWANKAYKQQSINQYEDKIGKKCFHVLHSRVKPCEFCQLENGLIRNQTDVYEYYDERTQHYYIAKTSPVFNGSDRPIGYVKVISDITDKTNTENALIEAKEKAEKADYLKSAFLANMSHEIRTPMNAIIGFSELLEDDELNHEQKTSYLRIIQSNGQQLLKLISDILIFSQLESGHIELHYTTIRVSDLMTEVYQQFAGELEKQDKSRVSIELDIDGIDNNMTLRSDSIRLKQIIFNLMTNAIKFTSEGRILLKAYPEDEMLIIMVKDSGIGIPKDQLENIFMRFSQIENQEQRKSEGSGLGLTIANDLIALLGGWIDVSSKVGEGSTFCIYHPLVASDTLSEYHALALKNL